MGKGFPAVYFFVHVLTVAWQNACDNFMMVQLCDNESLSVLWCSCGTADVKAASTPTRDTLRSSTLFSSAPMESGLYLPAVTPQ